ncbi:MAG: hypothetical protein M0T75_01685 [Chloroflexi bacterium]|nr:hypothetical protein [Chloroflexota bacterium]
MPQLHLRAEPEDYAPIVLLPGDPNRATAISVQATGIGAPAAATGVDVRAATILTVSDVLGEGVTSEQSYLPLDELERRTATTLQAALAAAISSAVTAGL